MAGPLLSEQPVHSLVYLGDEGRGRIKEGGQITRLRYEGREKREKGGREGIPVIHCTLDSYR